MHQKSLSRHYYIAKPIPNAQKKSLRHYYIGKHHPNTQNISMQIQSPIHQNRIRPGSNRGPLDSFALTEVQRANPLRYGSMLDMHL